MLPCNPLLCAKPHPKSTSGGFALVISLALLAFIVGLLLSISVLVSVETGRQTNRTQIVEARANALLGAGIAIGKLQKTIGPDKVITANASLAADPAPEKSEWLGAWPSDAPDSITWLVSGEEEAETASNTATSTQLPGMGETRVPKVS
ncbi:MAG: hypothetical protein ACQKBT_02200, partial [Puniceicoccales bacterium]